MTSIQAAFQPVKFAISTWHAEVSPQIERLDDAKLQHSIQWSFALSMTPLPRSDQPVLTAQLGLRLRGEWRDEQAEEVPAEPRSNMVPFSFETMIVGVFTYAIGDAEELGTAIETFIRFLKRNGTAYLYSTLRPVVRNFFLTSVGKQILLPAVNMHEAFKTYHVPLDEWFAHYERQHGEVNT